MVKEKFTRHHYLKLCKVARRDVCLRSYHELLVIDTTDVINAINGFAIGAFNKL